MRSKTVTAGIALVASGVIALVLATWAIGGSQTRAASQVGAAGNA